MAQATAIRLTGDDLRIERRVGGRRPAKRPRLCRTKRARRCAPPASSSSEPRTERREHTYGINTGFGRFVSKSIPEEQTEELQLRLLRSHACGVGDPYPAEIVRAAMLLRANALAKGTSGARIETVELLLECLARGIVPRVPSRGSVGASGDLAPLAHLALPLVGEGEAWFDGELMSGADALAAAGLEPTRLAAKEGLSLDQRHAVHGRVRRARRHSRAPARAGGRSRVRALARGAAGIAHELPAADPPAAPAARVRRASAANVLRLIEGSAINESHKWCDKVQDAYSLRCAPQVHGAVARPARLRRGHGCGRAQRGDRQSPRARRGRAARVERELPRPAASRSRSTRWRWRASELANISERRVERLVNPNLSDGLPAFLTSDGGLNSGFMIPQYVAASLVSENKSLCHPASVDSIPTSAGQEDHVSMGNAAGAEGVAGARELRARPGDRVARRRAGRRVPRAAGAGRRRARDAWIRPLAVAATRRRPSARAPTSRRWPRRFATARSSPPSRPRWESSREHGAAARRRCRRALRRPLPHPRAARDRVTRARVGDGGAAAHAAQQPRPRGRRAARGARRLRRFRQGGAESRGVARDRSLAARARARTRRCSCRAASPSASFARTRARRAS